MKNSNILISGGSGFLGSHLVPLLRKHHSVMSLSSSDCDLSEQQEVIRLFQTMKIKGWKPDIVLNLAALVGGIGFNQEHPAELFYKNSLMGIFLMHEAYKHGVKKFVQIGTICAYPKHTEVPFREENLWMGYPEETNAPYGLAKKMLLVQAQAYRKQYGFNAIYLLPVNMYGPGDNFQDDKSHVIPALIKRFIEAKETGKPEVVIWGTGKATREFLYVEDAARAIELATEKYDGDEPINIGSGKEISILDLANLIKEEVGYDGNIVFDSSKPDGQPRRRLDTSKAKEFFGFEAKTDFREGLRKTIQWYSTYRSGGDCS